MTKKLPRGAVIYFGGLFVTPKPANPCISRVCGFCFLHKKLKNPLIFEIFSK